MCMSNNETSLRLSSDSALDVPDSVILCHLELTTCI